VPDRLYFTESDAANALIASDPMALLVGFVLDQQVTVQQAFVGPLTLRQRLGTFDAATLAKADLEPVFREKPAIHRYPGSMAKRVHDLAIHIEDRYDGDAARVWTDAADPGELRANLEALPGFGEMKVKSMSAVLAKRYGVKAAKARASAPHARRRRFAAGAARLPGSQAQAQGRVEEDQEPRVADGPSTPSCGRSAAR
jgi:uncharacterized HhH-GPD family protein